MSQPVHVRSRVLTYAAVVCAFLAVGSGLYWLVDRYFINPELSFQALDSGSRQVRFSVAPDFTLPDLQHQPVHLADFAKQVVIVNFWASWCAPCVEEFPSLMKYVEQFKGQVVLLAVSQDAQMQDVTDFLSKFSVQPNSHFQVVFDLDRRVGQAYGVGALPESFIFSQGLKFERKIVGFRDWMSPVSLAEVQKLIQQP